MSRLLIHDSLLLNALPFSIAIVNETGEIIKTNAEWNKFMSENDGSTQKCGLHANYLQVSIADPVAYSALHSVLNGSAETMSWEYECHSVKLHRWFLAVVSAIRDNNGYLIGAVVTHIDMSDRKEAELVLKQMAIMDPVVKVPNRRHLINYGRKLLRQADEERFKVGGLFIDLDDFKAVNDTHGHYVGDELLRIVGQRIHHSLRDVDVVCRYGGDEFFALLPQLNTEFELRELAQRLLYHLQESVKLGNDSMQVSVSIGGKLRGPLCGTISEFIRACDNNMYAAKRGGKAQVHL